MRLGFRTSTNASSRTALARGSGAFRFSPLHPLLESAEVFQLRLDPALIARHPFLKA
jgi:hypothetical protein